MLKLDMVVLPGPSVESEDTTSPKVVPLDDGVTATVSSDKDRVSVYLSIAGAAGDTPLTLKIPADHASDLAVALVNAANGL